MGFNYMKFSILLLSTILLQSLAFAAGEPTDQFIIPNNAQKDQAFHMVVIGDSIAWGNGLNQENKYYYLVAERLHERLNKPIEVTVYAHSGARIFGGSVKRLDPNLNSEYPTLMDQAKNIQNKENVDLILVSGGINDVGLMNVINVNTPATEIQTGSESIEAPMESLLTNLLTNNKKAKIIVTNYYPIISDNTNENLITGAVSLIIQLLGNAPDEGGALISNNINQKSRLIENSYTFNGVSTTSLINAVNSADNDAKRIAFAMVNFPSERCYGTDTSWLWELTSLSPPTTNDDRYGYRSTLCGPADIINRINAIGHPNVYGAREYARAIESAIRPNWFNNDAQATSVTSDETTSGTTESNNLPDISQWLKSLFSQASMWAGNLQNMLSSTTGWPLFILVIALALIIGGSLIRRSLWDFIMNAISGLVVIYLSSTILGIGISITTPTLLVCAIGGFPGAIILIALKYFYGITF